MSDGVARFDLGSLPHAWPKTGIQGVLRDRCEDFIVDELLGFEPDGNGQYAWLQIEKRDSNTAWVAHHLAELAGVDPRQVSYAGLKDRRAVTRQWFSIDLRGIDEPDWTAIESDAIRLLRVTRHPRRLGKGMHAGNRFTLILRELQGPLEVLDARLHEIAARGVPNYFTEQRFGHEMGNLGKARQLFAGRLGRIDRNTRGFYLSAARAWLFNEVLARRVAEGIWDSPIDGDVLIYADSQTPFQAFVVDQDMLDAIAAHKLHPTGPLHGRGPGMARKTCERIEAEALSQYADWCQGLERAGLRQARRALRLCPGDMRWQRDGSGLRLSFDLPPGGYATAVLRECIAYRARLSRT